MPDITIHTDLPEGTILGAFKRTQLMDGQRAPVGAPVASATVLSRSVTFVNLARDTNYVAYAEVDGQPRLLRFSTTLARRDVFVDELGTIIDPAGNAIAGAGQPGNPGPPGPPGNDGITSSDAVRGALDRYYRLVAGAVQYTGTGWELVNDASSRPQNIDSATSDTHKISLSYATIGALHVGGFTATPNEDLLAVGIRPIVKASISGIDVTLRQDRVLADFVYWDGAAWVKDKGALSPFTLTGLDGSSADYPAAIAATSGLQASWRFSEASGAVIQDETVNNRDGAVVSTGTTYGVTSGAPVVTDGTPDKAMRVATGGTNEFTFPSTGTTQALFSVEVWLKVPVGSTVVVRDHQTSTTSGYWIAKNLTTGVIQYRAGTAAVQQTAYLWSNLEGIYRHIVFTKNGTTVKLYIDGALVHTGVGDTGAIVSPWHLGRSGHGAGTPVSQAVEVSEASSYNVELSAATVRAHYYAGSATGALHFAHESTGSTSPGGIILTAQGITMRPVLGAVNDTGFDVNFYDASAVLQTTPTTGMKASIVRNVAERTVNPASFTAKINVAGDDYDAAVIADGPTSYWTLADTVGASVAAATVGTPTGTIGSGVTMGDTGLIVPDAHTAATFDGTANGKIVFPSPALSNTPFSLEVWFKRTGAGTIGGTNFSAVFGWTTAAGTRRFLLKDDGSWLIAAGGANLTTGAVPAWLTGVHHLAFTWDLLTQRLYIDGVLVASGNTASLSVTNPLIAGAYDNPVTNYAFKGSLARFAVYGGKTLTPNQVQQHYAVGAGVVLNVDRAVGSRITFQGIFETGPPAITPPPDQPLPTATPLPANDLGGAVTGNVHLDQYRATIGVAGAWFKRALPTDVPGRNAVLLNGVTVGANSYPAATSENWRQSLCDLIGFDKNTPPSQLTPNLTTPTQSGSLTPVWLSPGLRMYIVPDDQPLRPFIDQDVTISGWAAEINAINVAMGGWPIPADARPDPSQDRYAYIFQPSQDRMINIYDFHGNTPATTTMQLTGSPSQGAFGLKFLYRDNALNATATYFLQTLIPYNATAAQVKSAIDGAKTAAGSVFGNNGGRPGSYYGSCVATGGPLNVAPITVSFKSVDPLQPVAFIITDFFLNSGTVEFIYTNAGPYDRGRLAAITTPSPDGHIALGVSGWTGSYSQKTDNSGMVWMDSRWGPTATGIDQSVLIPSAEEYQAAQVNGTNLGHVIALRIGNCMGAPFSKVFPANRGDGTFTRADGSMITEGARIAFPPDIDLSGVIPEFLPMARTMRDYGCVIYDKTGQGSEFVMRNTGFPDTTIPNAWLDMLPLYKTAFDAPMRYMRSLPWHKVQIIAPSFSA